MPKIVSANRLADGIVVYLGRDRSWLENLDLAQCFAGDVEAAAGLAGARDDARRNLVVDPFLVEVEPGEEGPRPLGLRDMIRARGPTIDYAPSGRPETARADRS